jgi:3'-phosphoadenosine 5'-phosphosulfate sulfotransferase (PAPS reductase)/FAD synthetase
MPAQLLLDLPGCISPAATLPDLEPDSDCRPYQPALADYDWILINSSAGKDSMAMLAYLVGLADAAGVERRRIVVVHADLGRVEWAGTRELAEYHARTLGLRFEVVARQEDLLDHVLTRNATLRARPDDDGKAPAWPSNSARWCTSDHKSSQVSKLITRLVAESDPRRLGRRVKILNALGIRASESIARSKKIPFGPDPAHWSKPPQPYRPARKATAQKPAQPARPARPGVPHGLREVHRWLPIFCWDEEAVWAEIVASGLPWHPAYFWVDRLSCVICVLAPREQLVIAARLNPALARAYVRVERAIGHTLKPGVSMVEIAADAGVSLDGLDDDQFGEQTSRQIGVPGGPGVTVPWVPIPDIPALANLVPAGVLPSRTASGRALTLAVTAAVRHPSHILAPANPKVDGLLRAADAVGAPSTA